MCADVEPQARIYTKLSHHPQQGSVDALSAAMYFQAVKKLEESK
jgi:hypothetical protein